MAQSAPQSYRFGRFAIDMAAGTLTVDGMPAMLRPKSLAVLCILAANAGRLMSKAAIAEAVWHTAVSDESLARCISDIRRALGPTGHRVIRTVPRRGYLLASESSLPMGASVRRQWAVVLLSAFDASEDDSFAGEFARGLAEDLAVALDSCGCRVVFQTTHGAPAADAHYRLVGSVRRDGSAIRVVAQLVDEADGCQVWAERCDRRLGRVLALQGEISERIAAGVSGYLASAITQPDAAAVAYRHFARGEEALLNLDHDARGFLGQWLARARASLAQCLELEPEHAVAAVELGQTFDRTYLMPTTDGLFGHEFRRAETLEHALMLAEQAVARFPNFASAHSQLGWTLHWCYRRREAVRAFERALEIDPGHHDMRFALVLSHLGRAGEALTYLARRRRQDSPTVPGAGNNRRHLGIARFLAGQYGAAADTHTSYARDKRGHLDAQVWRAIVNGKVGRLDESRQAAAEILGIMPGFTIAGFLDFTRFASADGERAVSEGLRRAGLPQ